MINPLLYFLLLLKASLFSTGGMGNLPSVHQDFLGLGWANEQPFGQAIAVAQVSPGPNGLWVVSFGYLTYGLPGAILAFTAILIPPFTILIISSLYSRIQNHPSVKGIMRGIALAVIGLVIAVAWSLIDTPSTDWRGWLITLVAFGFAASRKVSAIVILAAAAVVGFLIYGL